MSTRATIHLIYGDNRKIIYQHCDGYPNGLGCELVKFIGNFLSNDDSIANFIETIHTRVNWVNSSDIPSKEDADRYIALNRVAYCGGINPMESFGESRMRSEWYSLLRMFQGVDGLYALLKEQISHLINLKDDPGDIEYSYHLNFNDLQFSCYSHESADKSKRLLYCSFAEINTLEF